MASMPDLIFTVLFFFMIVTHMRTETAHLKVTVPDGKELTKATHKRTISTLYVGTNKAGETQLQLGNHLITMEQLGAATALQRNALAEEDRELYTVNIKADKQTPMGVINDIKQELRRTGTLYIRYSAVEGKRELKD